MARGERRSAEESNRPLLSCEPKRLVSSGPFAIVRVLHPSENTRTGLPLAWEVQTARSHESNYVAPLLGAAGARGFAPATVAMEIGYDDNRVYAECAERGCAAVVPLRKGQPERNLRIPRSALSRAPSTAAAPRSSASSGA